MKEGRILSSTELSKGQKQLLKRLGVKPPPKIERVELGPPDL
jgi:hypothetical protein